MQLTSSKNSLLGPAQIGYINMSIQEYQMAASPGRVALDAVTRQGSETVITVLGLERVHTNRVTLGPSGQRFLAIAAAKL